MRKQHLSKFITIFFVFITILLINTLNSYSVKGAENENKDEYYLLTKDCYYTVENTSDKSITFNQYSKDEKGNYIKEDLPIIDYDTFYDLNNPPLKYLWSLAKPSITIPPNENLLFTTATNHNTFVKIPSCCKVTKVNNPYWTEYILKKVKV